MPPRDVGARRPHLATIADASRRLTLEPWATGESWRGLRWDSYPRLVRALPTAPLPARTAQRPPATVPSDTTAWTVSAACRRLPATAPVRVEAGRSHRASGCAGAGCCA